MVRVNVTSGSDKKVSDNNANDNSANDNNARDTNAEEYVLTAGNYYGGEDIPVGRYDMVWVSGIGLAYVYRTDGYSPHDGGTFNEDYIKIFRNTDVMDGTMIRISNNLKIKFIRKK